MNRSLPGGADDDHIIYRKTVRNVAWQQGLHASLAPEPFADQAGSGCHIHCRACDISGERYLFFGPNNRYNLSHLACQFMAGVLDHSVSPVALTCPRYNSYHLGTGLWRSAFVCFGPDNREVALRIPSLFSRA